MNVVAAIGALERRDHNVASLARLCGRAESDVVLEVANQYWLWGEPDRALPILEEQLARVASAPLQMAHLRCLISLAEENRTTVKAAVANLQAILRARLGAQAAAWRRPRSTGAQTGKLRLGFLCTYSNLKPVELSLVPMLRAIDRSRFHTSSSASTSRGTRRLARCATSTSS